MSVSKSGPGPARVRASTPTTPQGPTSAASTAKALASALGQPLSIRRVALSSLRPDPANVRAHNERNLEAIQASLSRFGQAEPLIVQRGTGRIVGGHGRLAAMKALGWAECDVVELDLSSIDATALGIALNRTAELAEWDEPALAEVLSTLRAEDGLDGVGFSTAEIDELLSDLGGEAGALVEDQGPEPPPENPVTRMGDLWLLGDHRLLCGDSTKPDDIARVLAGEKAALLATDPPYCVEYTGDNRPVHDGKRSGKDWSHVYREVDIADLGTFLDGFLAAALPHALDDAPVYLWHAHTQQPVVAACFERHGLLFHQVLVWVKPCAVFGHSYYQWQHEPCAFGWKRGHKPKHGTAQLSSVWQEDWDGKARFSTFHPCLHPEALVLAEAGYRPIRTMSVGERVLAADGRFHAVTDVSSHPYQSAELVRISAKGGNIPTLASDNHPFLVWRPRRHDRRVLGGEVIWSRADELRVGDYTMTPVTAATAEQADANAPERIEHEGRAYTLRYIKSLERVSYAGDVWNLTVEGSPTFQTAVGMSHNTSKPTRLFEIPIEQHTRPGAILLEPFSGSGSQLIAAEKQGRRCCALELAPAFVDGTVARFEKATGKQAVLEASGKCFAEVARERGGK